MQNVRMATDYALWATKVNGAGFWLGDVYTSDPGDECGMMGMQDAKKGHFLDAPISLGGLFSDTVVLDSKEADRSN